MVYPLVSTGLAQTLMPEQANGSLLRDESGKVVGSSLIGQDFTGAQWFHGRVSSIGYQAQASGSNNYGPSNPLMLERTRAFIAEWHTANPAVPISQLPLDLATNSGSGLDPHISPAAAEVQIPRISAAAGITEDILKQLVGRYTEGRDLGIFGEKRVNVLKLNLALKGLTEAGSK
jgi:K+-transporting ATPase ATPase C chain